MGENMVFVLLKNIMGKKYYGWQVMIAQLVVSSSTSIISWDFESLWVPHKNDDILPSSYIKKNGMVHI